MRRGADDQRANPSPNPNPNPHANPNPNPNANPSPSPNQVERISELTGGKKVDLCFEVIGLKQTFEQAVMAVRDG
jgi:threonine dehydrogenase-like Zn-dependent dehydrogenase